MFHDPRLAVRCAAVIDPACDVATVAAVDQVLVVQREQERVTGVGIVAEAAIGFRVREAAPAILDDPGAFGNLAGGKDAVAVNRRLAPDDASSHAKLFLS
jgi:hypothetical protein